jgi:hypothetical protein
VSRNLSAGIGRLRLAKLQPHHLDELGAVLGARGVPSGNGPLSPASDNRYHALIRAALRQAYCWGWIETTARSCSSSVSRETETPTEKGD